MRIARSFLTLLLAFTFCSITIAQAPAPPAEQSPLHVAQSIPLDNAVLFVAPQKGGPSFGFFKAPDGSAAGIPVMEVKQAMDVGYKPVTFGDMTVVIDSYVKAVQEQQRQINDLTADYNALVLRFNRLAAINSTTLASPRPPTQMDEKQAMRLMLFQSLLSRTAPQQPVRVEITDCKAYPASCVH
jgi:hypothetical protein